MERDDLLDRLKGLFSSARIPDEELEWLAEHGKIETWDAGTVVAPKGKRLETLWIILAGRIAIYVDRGSGPRRVMEWRTGDVDGKLPYSRMTGPPGDSYTEETTESLHVREDLFPEMIRKCPKFTAHTVHIMIDRVRTFNSNALQDEKMLALGKLSAGLAHELNNPASVALRAAKLIQENFTKAEKAAHALALAGFTEELLAMTEQANARCRKKSVDTLPSPIERMDREDEITGWLAGHKLNLEHAAALAETNVTLDTLDTLANVSSSDEMLDAVICWIAAGCTIQSLVDDIVRASKRIHEMVTAIKNFTYMDRLAGSDSVDVESTLRDTVLMVESKARLKSVAISMDIEPHLPRAYANGGELNQIWLNLVDNALDAVSESGHINIRAYRKLDRIVVHVIDDGSGIPPDIAPYIYDPFFTTKPQGEGTGLGLDITWLLLRRYHGDISFDSRTGRTDFRVSLLIEKSVP